MTLSEDLTYRGLIKDKTFNDVRWLDEPKKFYLGIDPSADSLTVGNLAVFLLAKRLTKAGWQAVLLVGGATSLVGDPGGKNEERELKAKAEIDRNVTGVAEQVKQLFAGENFELVNNYDWDKNLNFLDFLRDVGKHYAMSDLINREFINERLGEAGTGISYAEFSYTLLQGYDFWHLFKNSGVVLQIGGSDQWGNMLSGVPLIRKREAAEAHAMSMPLVINKATGKKFGKSEEGAVWLDSAKTSVYKFYQFWLNADDEGVEDYLKIFTELTKEEIEALMNEFRQNKSGRAAQKTLAYELTRLVHGEAKALSVQKASEVLFGSASFLELSDDEKAVLKNELAVVSGDGNSGLEVVLVEAGLASSNSDGRRFLEAGGVYINGKRWTGDGTVWFTKGLNLLKRGKNSFAIVEYKEQ